MIEIIDSPTEQTTAATDAILAVLFLFSLFYLRKFKRTNPRRVKIWSYIFGLLAVSAALGTVVHGFKMPFSLYCTLWQPLFLTLGLSVALFALAAGYDAWGGAIAKKIMTYILIPAVAFYAMTLLFPGRFLVFIIYEALALTFAFVVYILLAIRKHMRGAWLMAGGILITMMAAYFQTDTSIYIKCVWDFDYNSVFHAVQMIGLFFLIAGLRAGLIPK